MGWLVGDVMLRLCGAEAELQRFTPHRTGFTAGTLNHWAYWSCLLRKPLPHHRVFDRKQQNDSSSVQREDAGAPPGVSLLLLHPPPTQRRQAGSRRGGPEPVQHPGHGGDRAEQAGERPGLRGHPEAAHLRRRPRAPGDHAASPEALSGGDPEETGRRSGEEEVSGGGAAEAPGREEGARAGSRSESSDQRAPRAPRRRRRGPAADAPERLAGATAGGGQAQCGGVLMA